MTAFVALLRAVNVGGTAKLPMETLVSVGRRCGFASVSTYIASGNLVFSTDRPEAEVRTLLESELVRACGWNPGVLVRDHRELKHVVANNPFADRPGNRVVALFTDDALPTDPLAGATGLKDESIVAGPRAVFVHYPGGIGSSRLKLPLAATGTARNLNTVGELAARSAAVS